MDVEEDIMDGTNLDDLSSQDVSCAQIPAVDAAIITKETVVERIKAPYKHARRVYGERAKNRRERGKGERPSHVEVISEWTWTHRITAYQDEHKRDKDRESILGGAIVFREAP